MNDSIMSLRPDVVVTVLEDSAVLLDLQSKFFYSVNSTGWSIVQMLENGASKDQIMDQCMMWGAPNDDSEKIDLFLQVFLNDDLVTMGEGGAENGGIESKGAWTSPTVEKHKEPLQKVMVSAFDPSLPLAE